MKRIILLRTIDQYERFKNYEKDLIPKIPAEYIAFRLNLSRGTVIHHINKLIDAGIVTYYKNRYMLRVDNLEVLIDEVEKDIKRTCEGLKSVAKEIDRTLGL